MTDEQKEIELIDEWRSLFNRYRNDGKLSPNDRARFRELSAELRKRGILNQPVL